jgi:hypothetical protein
VEKAIISLIFFFFSAKTAATPGPVAAKNPVAVPQGVTTAMRRAPSGTALTGKPAAGQPRALPQPNTHRVTASTDTNLTTFKEGSVFFYILVII